MPVLDDLFGFDFEDVMEDVFRNLGYENVRQADRTADEGRDILIVRHRQYRGERPVPLGLAASLDGRRVRFERARTEGIHHRSPMITNRTTRNTPAAIRVVED